MHALRISAGISALFWAILAMPASAQLAGLFREDVPTISLDELLAALEDGGTASGEVTNGVPVLLVDARSSKESSVSIIPGAITRAAYENDAAKYDDYRIVPYCTVGVRSERYTRELRRDGVDAVNFEGSIIAWVEAGLPLVTPSGEPTRQVHTWSSRFRVPPGYVQVTK